MDCGGGATSAAIFSGFQPLEALGFLFCLSRRQNSPEPGQGAPTFPAHLTHPRTGQQEAVVGTIG